MGHPDILCCTLMKISSLCSQLLWFWKRFSSFQMFSSRSACLDSSPRVCWSSWERSDIRVAFSVSTSCRREDTWERETGEEKSVEESQRFVLSVEATIPQLKQKSPNQVSFTINHGARQHCNVEQMLSQAPAVILVVYLCWMYCLVKSRPK